VIRRAALALLVLGALSRSASAQRENIDTYIKQGWKRLTRTHAHLLAAAIDPKVSPPPARWPVYVSEREDLKAVEARLRAEMPAADFARIELRRLPAREPGLLYLPWPYVVPGGRFNEMYGWDSYFIVLGLLRDGEVELARGMVDNFVYEIENYGHILNANRSYYLTRSQPPFLTEMILAVYGRTKDRAWLTRTVPAIEKYYTYWTAPPHLTPETGLSRYHDLGSGPAREVEMSEKDAAGLTHYDRVKRYYRSHASPAFYDAAHDRLTDLFYLADRSMRESGFDPSDRFGPFGSGVLDYNPVCLNSLLYRMEQETAEILRILGNPQAPWWDRRAQVRRERIQRLLWDPQRGLFLDYDFRSGKRRDYPFATTFFPLWAGVATREQAGRVAANLPLFERPGGIQTSTVVSGQQWDAPCGWAPLQLIAVRGLRRYGHDEAANRIATEFLSLVKAEFAQHNAIFEKYDVVSRRSSVSAGLRFGYSSNEIGFGWTNAVFAVLLDELPQSRRAALAR
jgi:alpha,alpha-trehalase